ncbi:PREDICTED: UPF0481 protein At3g47200-like [Nelumbo nucifera]|uniref:Uncharacterized protein n=2 Tax=Nelumbo nucifera TaxID=4432 RepID=A0A822ZNE1_NELNU|nr:PREDICTED: UPF0481 protein At3g47200-like [Nelumbo nucifera]DAD46293.1 TPA_asm: hypothetical protein HUJ06_004523 [Nelumbo nucifera]
MCAQRCYSHLRCHSRRMASGNVDSHHTNADVSYVTLDISDLSKELAASTLKDLEELTGKSSSSYSSSSCIHRVPEKFHKINQYAYVPELIAIGPNHHGKESLQTMEEHKKRYVKALLNRISTTQESNFKKLGEFFNILCFLEEEIHKSYSEISKMSRNDFLKMMLFDGFFMIELFLRSAEVKKDENDPIFNTNWLYASLVRDMILLENQLPLFVLDKLFVKTKSKFSGHENQSLTRLALRFFKPLIPNDQHLLLKASKFTSSKHLLDLVYKVLLVDVKYLQPKSNPGGNLLLSVTRLRRAGIKFKKGHEETSFLDIKFSHGVLEIPPVHIEDHFEVLLRNLIAWEQCSNSRPLHVVTSYAFLMNKLISTTEEVGFLCHRGIITNYLGGDEEVSLLFNNLCKEVTLVNFCYSEVCNQVKSYCKNRLRVWLPTFIGNYF